MRECPPLLRLPLPPLTQTSPPPEGLVSEYGVTFKTHIVDTFGVSFGREGETMSLGCTVIIYPNLERYQPGVEWYRDGEAGACLAHGSLGLMSVRQSIPSVRPMTCAPAVIWPCWASVR